MAKKETTKKSKPTATKEVAKLATPKAIELIPGKRYEFISNGKSPSMKKDQVFKVSGVVAMHFHKMGFGKVIH